MQHSALATGHPSEPPPPATPASHRPPPHRRSPSRATSHSSGPPTEPQDTHTPTRLHASTAFTFFGGSHRPPQTCDA